MTRVVITGLGMVSPLGVGTKHCWTRLMANESGLVSTRIFPDYDESWSKIPSQVVGKVPSGLLKDGCWDPADHPLVSDARRVALFTQYALAATQEALDDAKWTSNGNADNVGVAIGSGIGSFHDIYDNSIAFSNGGYRKVQPLFIPKLLTNMAAGNVSMKFGLRGPNHTVSTACATGLNAIGDAYNFIRNGYADAMVAGATESLVHPLALAGFARARSVVTNYNDEPEKASRPFDGARNGFVLGEGCGILMIESLEHALNRGVDPSSIYAEILGYGLAGDAHHITAPPEDGNGAYRAMKMALKMADTQPEEINYVNAHATSTVIGDRSEIRAIQKALHETPGVAVSSTKSSTGHLLGAAGAVERIFTILSVKNNAVPATRNLDNAGHHADDDAQDFSLDLVPNISKEMPVNKALCNSFGFGGVNTSICYGKFK